MPPGCKRLTPGFELEWFAMTLGAADEDSWLDALEFDGEETKDWVILTGNTPRHRKLGCETTWEDSDSDKEPDVSNERNSQEWKSLAWEEQQTSEPAHLHGPSKAHRIMTILVISASSRIGVAQHPSKQWL